MACGLVQRAPACDTSHKHHNYVRGRGRSAPVCSPSFARLSEILVQQPAHAAALCPRHDYRAFFCVHDLLGVCVAIHCERIHY